MNKSTGSKRPFIFLGIGIFNTLLDFAFFTFLTIVVFKGNDNIAVVGLISGTFALLCAFVTHSLVTWRDKELDYRVFIRFLIFTGFGLWAIRPLLLTFFVTFTGLYSFVYGITSSYHMPFNISFITNTGAFGFMIIIVLVYNYFVYQRFVFKDTKNIAPDTQKN